MRPPASPGWHKWVLAGLMAVFVVRGLFWAGTVQLFSPIDELQHADYVAALAEGDGIPVVGEAIVRDKLLAYTKFAHSNSIRYAPHLPRGDDDTWGPTRESYEAFQGPTYYALMTPAWRIGRGVDGTRGAVFATRAASVLLTSLSLLVAWALARRLFPKRPAVWLTAPAVLAVATGATANIAVISNEALVIPLAGAALLPLAGAYAAGSDGLTRRRALLTGLLVGLAVVTKTTCISLIPLVVLGVAGIAALQRSGWRPPVRFLLWTGVAGAATLAPWLAWNYHAYGASSANEAVDAITGPLQPFYSATPHDVIAILRWAMNGYWDLALGAILGNAIAMSLFAATAVLGVIAIVRRWLAGDRGEAFALTWLALAFPMVFATMLVVIFIVFHGHSGTVGRHMYPSLVATAVLVAAAAIAGLGRRVGFVVLAALAVLAMRGEIISADRYISSVYETLVAGDRLFPARDLRAGDGLVKGGDFVVRPTCRAEGVGIVTGSDPSPTVLAYVGTAPPTPIPIIGDTHLGVVRGVAVYKLPAPTRELIRVIVDPVVTLGAAQGAPIAEAWCKFKDPEAARFKQTFTPDHPRLLTHTFVHAWPRFWFAVAWVALAVALLSAFRVRRQPR